MTNISAPPPTPNEIWAAIDQDYLVSFSATDNLSVTQKGGRGYLMCPACLESQSCHFNPVYHLLPLLFLSCLFSCLLPHSSDFFFNRNFFGMFC